MNAQAAIIQVPLSQLRLSPRNARKTGGQNIEGLAASIAAHNLLQNLTVTPGAAGDEYQVVAGGRRLAAMQLLRDRGQLDAEFSVPCKLITDDGAALEASTAENTLREAMHPADQFDAFKDMVEAQKSITDVAAHFGVTELVVKQRLKLANVAPEFFAMYRAGNEAMTLDHLIALATTEDHEAQRVAWAGVPPHNRSATALRNYLTRGKVSGNTAVAQLVGATEYVAAGGNIERDLFSDTVYFLDPQLLDSLALDKLKSRAADHIDAGWNWAHAQLEMDYQQLSEYPHHPRRWDGVDRHASPEDEQREKEIDARLEEIDDIDGDELSESENIALDAEGDRLREEQQAIEERMIKDYPAEVMAQSGVLIFIGSSGMQVEYARLKHGEKAGGTGRAASSTSAGANPGKKPVKKPEISEALRTTLSAHRSEAARAQIWRDPNLAFALLLQRLLTSYSNRFYENNGVGIRLEQPMEAAKVADIHKTLRDQTAEAKKLLDEAVKTKPRLESLVALGNEDRMRLLAALVSHSFNGITGSDKGHDGTAAIHGLTGFNMSDHWTPATDNFIGRISRELQDLALAEAHPERTAGSYLDGLKKDDRASIAAANLAGTGWLPKLLRGPGYGATAPTKAQESRAKPTTQSSAKSKPAAKKAPRTAKSAQKASKKVVNKPAKKPSKAKGGNK